MKRIKVGQIWEDETSKFVITHKFSLDQPLRIYYSYIHQDGDKGCYSGNSLRKLNIKLIAEYPTWQEAVNSEEFRK